MAYIDSEIPTEQAPCIQGSPSICIGNVFLVFITTSLHCANLRPDALRPVLTWPMCRQFSRPITSMRWSPISWMATDKSTELKLVVESSLSTLRNFPAPLNGPFLRILFCDKCSPHRFEPPWVYGMLSRAIPCKWGPLASSKDTPSHCKEIELEMFGCFWQN